MTLQDYLRRYPKQAEETVAWGKLFLFRVVSYFTGEIPPLEFVTSTRSMLLKDNQVLVVRNADGRHIVPGGKREGEESLTETLYREVLEETGWQIDTPEMLGVWHFHHLKPMPPDYPYPYPDFLHLIYQARAVKFVPEAKKTDDYELECRFMPIDAAMQIIINQPNQMKFLKLVVSKGIL